MCAALCAWLNALCIIVVLTAQCVCSQLTTQFNDEATQTHEYPSEQSLMDATPAQPGDCDYPDPQGGPPGGGEEDDAEAATLRLKAAPGLGANSSGL